MLERGGFLLTADVFRIDVADRIALTGFFKDLTPEEADILNAQGVGRLTGFRFFTNQLDTLLVRSTGAAAILPLAWSRAPNTGCLPTVPRPARSFFGSCLLRSLPPAEISSTSTGPADAGEPLLGGGIVGQHTDFCRQGDAFAEPFARAFLFEFASFHDS